MTNAPSPFHDASRELLNADTHLFELNSAIKKYFQANAIALSLKQDDDGIHENMVLTVEQPVPEKIFSDITETTKLLRSTLELITAAHNSAIPATNDALITTLNQLTAQPITADMVSITAKFGKAAPEFVNDGIKAHSVPKGEEHPDVDVSVNLAFRNLTGLDGTGVSSKLKEICERVGDILKQAQKQTS